jgi:uncharacterized RmlC-like cupin family protein
MGHGQMLRVSKDLRVRVSRVSQVTRVSSGDAQADPRASHLHLMMIPPGMRGTPHVHAGQQVAVFMVSGVAEVFHGAGLTRRATIRAGDVLYLPPGMPHLLVNRADATSIAVVARDQPAPDRIAGGAHGDAGPVTRQDDTRQVELPRHLAGLRALPVAERG